MTEPEELAIGLAVAETPPTPSANAAVGLVKENASNPYRTLRKGFL